jgi:hypothetical protein
MERTGKKIGVLVFPAGEVNSIELHDALATCVNIELYGASSVDRHGEYVFKNYISGVPMLTEPDFIDAMNRLIESNGIDVIFPTHDTVAEFMSVNREKFNAKIIAADYRTAEICRDKIKTFILFSDQDFCPVVYQKPKTFPVFIKPRKGQGSVGAKLLRSEADIDTDIDWSDHVVCEYLPGEEYTVDCLTDKNGALRAVLPRSRRRIFAGITVGGQDEVLTEEVEYIARTINSRLRFLGLWFFQIKRAENGRFKLLEISTRCAGTMCLSRAQGINLPLLSVYVAMGYDVDVFRNPNKVTVDRTLISRYKTDYEYDRVYIDFDDTIIIGGKVHLPTIRFLYQCKNNGISVILLTRHDSDHHDSTAEALRRHGISQELFSEIHILGRDVNKPDRINPQNAIFIDNAFKERKLVHEKYGIPVFDVDGIEVLLDWRI